MEYRDKAQTWALVVLVLLGVNMVFDLGLIAAGYGQIDLLERAAREPVTEEEAAINDALVGFFAFGGLAVFLLTAVFWLIWLYRAYRALTETGSQATDRSPAWAVGCWFIPLLNLLHPFRITRELWHRSANQNADSTVPSDSPPLIAGWWLLYLVGGLVGRIAARQSGETLEALISATRWSMLSSLVSLISAALAFLLVRTLKQMQARWSEGAALAEEF
jgi:hypothetical protein